VDYRAKGLRGELVLSDYLREMTNLRKWNSTEASGGNFTEKQFNYSRRKKKGERRENRGPIWSWKGGGLGDGPENPRTEFIQPTVEGKKIESPCRQRKKNG